MKEPNPDAMLKNLAAGERFTVKQDVVLAAEDEAILRDMVAMIRQGHSAVLVVETGGGNLKYMFTGFCRASAVSAMGRVIEATAKKLRDR